MANTTSGWEWRPAACRVRWGPKDASFPDRSPRMDPSCSKRRTKRAYRPAQGACQMACPARDDPTLLDFARGFSQMRALTGRRLPFIRPRQLVRRVCRCLISSLDGEKRFRAAAPGPSAPLVCFTPPPSPSTDSPAGAMRAPADNAARPCGQFRKDIVKE